MHHRPSPSPSTPTRCPAWPRTRAQHCPRAFYELRESRPPNRERDRGNGIDTMAADNPIHKRRVNSGLTPLPGPIPISRLVVPDQSLLLDDDTLVGAYRTDLCLHQDRSATTITTYVQHLGAFRRWLVDHYPDTALPEVQGVHVKAFLLAEAGSGHRPRHPVLSPLRAALLLRVSALRGSHHHQPDGQDQGPRCPQAAHRGLQRR